MITAFRLSGVALLWVLIVGVQGHEAAAVIFSSETSNVPAADCYGLKLMAAAGVPGGVVHKYKFKGTCKKYISHREDGKEKSRSEEVTLWAEAKAEWDGQANTLEEGVSLKNPQGPYSGKVETIFKCTKDPIIYSTSCVVFAHNNTTNWEPFSYGPWNEKRPVVKGKTTLLEAIAFSKKAMESEASEMAKQIGSSQSSPPETTQPGKTLKKPESSQPPGTVKRGDAVSVMPPVVQSAEGRASQRSPVPPSEPIMAPGPDQSRGRSRPPDPARVPSVASDRPAGGTQSGQQMVARVPANMFTIEGEQLVPAGKASVNGGKVVVQPMAGFGQGWSQNAQLFWSGGAVGAVLDLTVDVPAASAYAVEVYLTRAPDYADLRMEIDGKPSQVTFSGFAPTVMAPNPMQAGKFSLQPGARKVSFMITGKYQQATNYFVGIDRIVFYPAGDP